MWIDVGCENCRGNVGGVKLCHFALRHLWYFLPSLKSHVQNMAVLNDPTYPTTSVRATTKSRAFAELAEYTVCIIRDETSSDLACRHVKLLSPTAQGTRSVQGTSPFVIGHLRAKVCNLAAHDAAILHLSCCIQERVSKAAYPNPIRSRVLDPEMNSHQPNTLIHCHRWRCPAMIHSRSVATRASTGLNLMQDRGNRIWSCG